MKFLRKTKKGFTIVELVIVIAVIAVLAAVLIPTFINLTAKANKAADESLVTNLNKALAVDEVDHEYNNMHDAVEGLKRQGYLASTLVTKSSDKLLFDQNTNRFLLETDKDDDIPAYEYWTIRDSYSIDEQEYSIYASDNFSTSVIEGLKVGFDAGDSKCVSSIEYVGVGTRRVVKIRTNDANTNLTIDASLDTVDHYDEVGKVVAEKVDLDNCYNEFGDAAYIKVIEGKVVAKNGGKIGVVFAANNDKNKVAVIKEEKGTIDKGLTVMQPVADTNVTRTGGIALEYSIDGEHAASATQEQIDAAIASIEAIGELSVAANTGVQPVNTNYVAVSNYIGYNSLQEAINAASNGDVVSLLKDYSTSNETLVISKDITLKGNNHSIENTRAKTASAYNGNNSGRDAAIYVNGNVTFEDLNLTTTKLCLVHVQASCANKTINLNNCVMNAPTNSYGFFVANGADKLNININNTTLRGWCAVYFKCSNSKININDSLLTGVNGATQAPSNGFGTVVIDGNMSSGDTTYGSNNNVMISNTDIYANTDTGAGANVEIWLLIQYRAHNNTVVVTGGNIYSTNPIAPENGWEYHHFSSGSDADVQATNTVTVNGVQYFGFPSNHD